MDNAANVVVLKERDSVTYKEKIDLEEKLLIAEGKLLEQCRGAEERANHYATLARRKRGLAKTFENARQKLWQEEADDSWVE